MKRAFFLITVSVICMFFLSQRSTHAKVQVYTGVDRPVVLAGRDDKVVVKIGLFPEGGFTEEKHLPLNVAVVLDKSGSMGSDNKMENAKQGAIEIVRRLNKNDIFSLIVYDSEPRVYIAARPAINKDEIIETIRHIYPGGNTALYGGVTFGAAEVRKNLHQEYINRIVLLSDGLANVGPSSSYDLANLGEALRKEGITVSTVGVGLDYNEDLMTVLAGKSGGNSYFAAHSDGLPKIFTEEIGEAMTLMARKIRILLECPQGVKPVSILGRDGKVYGQNMELTIENLYGKNEKFALFEIQIPSHKSGKRIEVARINVEYTNPFTKQRVSQERTLSVKYARSKKVVEKNADKDIIKSAALTRTSEMKESAIRLADEGKYEEAAGLFKKRGLELEKVSEKCDNDTEIIREAQKCQDNFDELMANKGMTRYQRKSIMSEAFAQENQQYYGSQEEKK